MTFGGLLIVIILAILIGALFYYVFKATGPWGTFWSFLTILILAGLATEAWIEPVGPVVWNVAWVPTFFVILLFALFLAAASPSSRYRERRETRQTRNRINTNEPPEQDGVAVAVGIFFWIFVLFFVVLAIWGIFT